MPPLPDEPNEVAQGLLDAPGLKDEIDSILGIVPPEKQGKAIVALTNRGFNVVIAHKVNDTWSFAGAIGKPWKDHVVYAVYGAAEW